MLIRRANPEFRDLTRDLTQACRRKIRDAWNGGAGPTAVAVGALPGTALLRPALRGYLLVEFGARGIVSRAVESATAPRTRWAPSPHPNSGIPEFGTH